MISVRIAEFIHNRLIDEFGGSKGIRDIALLEAALARPYASFDQVDLYPTAIEKASAIFESLIINHPFIDGNKRIAYTLMRLMLLDGGFDIDIDQQEKHTITIKASTGEIKFDEIKDWIQSKVIILK